MFTDRAVGRLIEPATGRAWNNAEFGRHCRSRVSYYAARGLGRLDRIFLHHGNSLEFFADLIAIWRLGGCAIPIDPRLTPFEVETLARAASPRASIWAEAPGSAMAGNLASLGIEVMTARDAHAKPKAAREPALPGPSPDDDALVLFTSGTTGRPKGVAHTHRSLRARWSSLDACLGTTAFRRTLCVLPTHFGHGLICNCLFPWLSGQDLHILPPFRPDILAQLGSIVDEFAITCMSSVPAMWRFAMKTGRPPRSRSLGRVLCGSAPLSASLWQSIREWTNASDVLNAYGITETGSWAAGTTMPAFVPEDGLIGVPWGGTLRILPAGTGESSPAETAACAAGESGQVWVRTAALMRGYLGRDDLTAEVVRDGWFATGDIGSIDERGVLYLRGREREEINKGGMKVHPEDIDSVVERFGATVDVCAFGYDDALQGQDVGIAVVLEPADPVTLTRLHEWAAAHLARHQMPRRWYLLQAIPRNNRGKVNRAIVAATCALRTPLAMRSMERREDDTSAS